MRSDPRGAESLIEYGHHLVHQGKLYYGSGEANSVTTVRCFVVTGALVLHAVMRAMHSAGGRLYVTENVQATEDGLIEMIPLNRLCTPVKTGLLSRISQTPTGISGGTVLPNHYLQAGVPKIIPGVRLESEYIFLANGKYLITIVGASSGNAQIEFEVYEE